MDISKKFRKIAFNLILIFATSLLFTSCMSISYKGLNKNSLHNKSVDAIIVPGVPFESVCLLIGVDKQKSRKQKKYFDKTWQKNKISRLRCSPS